MTNILRSVSVIIGRLESLKMDSGAGKRYTSVDDFLHKHGPLRSGQLQCVLVFRGSPRKGKSWTLNLLIDKLRRKATERIGCKAILGEGSLDCNTASGTVDRWLCVAIFGFKILVYTAGDDSEAVKAAFSLASAYQSDVLVTASGARKNSSSFKTLLAELKRSETPYIEEWRSEENPPEKTPEKQADELVAGLERLCSPTMR